MNQEDILTKRTVDTEPPVNMCERFLIKEELLHQLKLHRNLDITAQLSLNPELENIINCLKNLLEEAETVISKK